MNAYNLIRNVHTFSEIDETIPTITVKDLLPDEILNGPIFRYKGSLTTPPCTETVEWIVYKKPLKIASSQVSI